MATIQIKTIRSTDLTDFPTSEAICQLPRGIELHVVCGDTLKGQRIALREELENALPDFVIRVSSKEPTIIFLKLIEESEILKFEESLVQAARDYRQLARTLLEGVAIQLGISMDRQCPFNSFLKLETKRQWGRLDKQWQYGFHGTECLFTHLETGQEVEVILTYPDEYGVLDDYFFVRFLKTTAPYRDMGLAIYDEGRDGTRILKVLEKRGRLIRIRSSYGESSGVVAKEQ